MKAKLAQQQEQARLKEQLQYLGEKVKQSIGNKEDFIHYSELKNRVLYKLNSRKNMPLAPKCFYSVKVWL